MKQRDWQKLRDLRARFLSASDGLEDYWESAELLDLYDRFFAERIGWKWDAVLQNVQRLGWQPKDGPLVDWGCGTGMASRSYLGSFPEAREVKIWDRSVRARQFAQQKLRTSHPALTVSTFDPERPVKGTYLLSHVLNELSPSALDSLLDLLCRRATAVFWIEPGTYEISRALGRARDVLRQHFSLIAPCPHQLHCGMLVPENERHWCHHFASTPAQVHQDADWSAFARELEIDVRSVPFSHLVLDRQPTLLPVGERFIGRPRIYKGHARLLSCTAAGVVEKTVQQRDDPQLFRQMRKG